MKVNNDEKKIQEIIKDLFDAVPTHVEIDEDTLLFLKERHELESKSELYTIEGYIEHFSMLCEYGLDDKIMSKMGGIIHWHLENRNQEFYKSAFYKKFNKHPVVKKEVSDYDDKESLK